MCRLTRPILEVDKRVRWCTHHEQLTTYPPTQCHSPTHLLTHYPLPPPLACTLFGFRLCLLRAHVLALVFACSVWASPHYSPFLTTSTGNNLAACAPRAAHTPVASISLPPVRVDVDQTLHPQPLSTHPPPPHARQVGTRHARNEDVGLFVEVGCMPSAYRSGFVC